VDEIRESAHLPSRPIDTIRCCDKRSRISGAKSYGPSQSRNHDYFTTDNRHRHAIVKHIINAKTSEYSYSYNRFKLAGNTRQHGNRMGHSSQRHHGQVRSNAGAVEHANHAIKYASILAVSSSSEVSSADLGGCGAAHVFPFLPIV